MKKNITLAIVLIGLLSACSPNSDHSTSENITSSDVDASDATIEKKELSLDSTRQYIQTAYIKMQVRKLQETKEKIRQIVRQQKGFILSSELENTITDEKIIAISKDSSRKITQLATSNNYSLKIPNQYLDTTLELLEKLGIRIDNSVRKADDISMQWQQYANNDITQTIKELKNINATGSAGINKVMTIHELKNQGQTANSERKELAYNIAYSDVKLDIYESPIIQSILITNTDQYKNYRTPYGYQLKIAFANGLDIFLQIILFVADLWMVISLSLLLIVIYRYIKKRKSNKRLMMK